MIEHINLVSGEELVVWRLNEEIPLSEVTLDDPAYSAELKSGGCLVIIELEVEFASELGCGVEKNELIEVTLDESAHSAELKSGCLVIIALEVEFASELGCGVENDLT